MRVRMVVALAVVATGWASAPAGAEDTDQLRFYLALRAGGAYFTDDDSVPEAQLENPAAEAVGAAAIGLNFNKHWGLELAGEYFETGIEPPGADKEAEYTIVTIVPQIRFRYPLLQDRLTPYVVVGGGIGFGEVNDKREDAAVVGLGSDTSPLGTVGAGLEYFVATNIAIGFELKYLYALETTVRVNGENRDMRFDALTYSAGLRLLFPEARRVTDEPD